MRFFYKKLKKIYNIENKNKQKNNANNEDDQDYLFDSESLYCNDFNKKINKHVAKK